MLILKITYIISIITYIVLGILNIRMIRKNTKEWNEIVRMYKNVSDKNVGNIEELRDVQKEEDGNWDVLNAYQFSERLAEDDGR